MIEPIDFQTLRLDYISQPLDVEEVDPNPISQFDRWFRNVLELAVPEPNAMVLSTMGFDGTPNARVVLLKDFSQSGFTFFTNYLSTKGREIDHSPKVSLLFFWQALFRQVRIQGTIEKVAREQSELYFASRPRPAQIGAWTSPQSHSIPSRAWLEDRYIEMESTLGEGKIACPESWGGYQVSPNSIEFWQGRESRLHDRILYTLADGPLTGGEWLRSRLAP